MYFSEIGRMQPLQAPRSTFGGHPMMEMYARRARRRVESAFPGTPPLQVGIRENVNFAASASAGATQKHPSRDNLRMTPNPSFKPSPNGGPPGPVWRYAVHFRQSGPGVPPSVPA